MGIFTIGEFLLIIVGRLDDLTTQRDTHTHIIIIIMRFDNNNNDKNKNDDNKDEEVFNLPPFFDPILSSDEFSRCVEDDDDWNDFDDASNISRGRKKKKKKKKKKKTNTNIKNNNGAATSDKKTTTTTPSCAMNAEINGRFLLSEDDDDKVIQPDVARVLVLDNLWKEENEEEEEEEENDGVDCVKAFTKALASVRIVVPVGKEDETKKTVVDVRTSEEEYWERETVDRKGDDDTNKTLGAKPFIVDAASRNGGVEGERMLFERLRKVFPQTVFARAPVESFVFEEEGEEDGKEEREETTSSKKRYAYDSIVYNASDENSNFRYHVDGDPMTLLHPKSPFAKAYGGNYANRSSSSRGKNGTTIAKPRFVSLLAYLNDEWNPEWGGETKFLDEDSQVGVLVGAKPGRVVLFDSDVKHSACATTRDDDDGDENNRKRFSLVMKLIALPRKMLLSNANKDNKTKNEVEVEVEEEEEEVDLLRVNPTMGFGAATPIGSAERLRGVVEAFSRKSIRV